jgi:hypothetical protein
MELEFSLLILGKTPQISNFMKIFLVTAAFIHADGQKGGRDDADSRLLQLREYA